VAGILSVVFSGPILNNPDYLMRISANPNNMIIGAIFVLIMGFALALVPLLLFPILKKHNEVLALGYVVFRGALETALYIAMAVNGFFLTIVGQEYVKAGALHAHANANALALQFQALGTVLIQGNTFLSAVVAIVFPLGALMLYSLFYQFRLIPRWISGWGIIAVLLNLITGLLIIFQQITPFSTTNSLMNFPIFLQEMVMAVWLIAVGFNVKQR
jgi:hypothetical protein